MKILSLLRSPGGLPSPLSRLPLEGPHSTPVSLHLSLPCHVGTLGLCALTGIKVIISSVAGSDELL